MTCRRVCCWRKCPFPSPPPFFNSHYEWFLKLLNLLMIFLVIILYHPFSVCVFFPVRQLSHKMCSRSFFFVGSCNIWTIEGFYEIRLLGLKPLEIIRKGRIVREVSFVFIKSYNEKYAFRILRTSNFTLLYEYINNMTRFYVRKFGEVEITFSRSPPFFDGSL